MSIDEVLLIELNQSLEVALHLYFGRRNSRKKRCPVGTADCAMRSVVISRPTTRHRDRPVKSGQAVHGERTIRRKRCLGPMQFAASSVGFQRRSLQGDASLILPAEIAIDRTDAISRPATAASLDRNRSRVAIGKSEGGPEPSFASHG
jgi:hypothetical protein